MTPVIQKSLLLMLRKEGAEESRAEPPPPRGRAVETGSENYQHLMVMHLTAPNVWRAALSLQQLLHYKVRRLNKAPSLPKDAHVLIPRAQEHVTEPGTKDFSDVITVNGLEMQKLSWIIQMGPI